MVKVLLAYWIKKFDIVEFSPQFFFSQFLLNNQILPKVDKLKYSGFHWQKPGFDLLANEKFKIVQKSIFSLSFLGQKPSALLTYRYIKSISYHKLRMHWKRRIYERKQKITLNWVKIELYRLCHSLKYYKCIWVFNIEDL